MNITDEILNKIKENFDNEIYLVGGSVRDYFMGIQTHDRDIIVMDEDAKDFSLSSEIKITTSLSLIFDKSPIISSS